MQRISVAEIQNTGGKALEQAESEPVLLTAESQSSYVIMSVDNYDRLIERLEMLEDFALGELAQAAVSSSRMVGTEMFAAELQRLAAMDGDG
jgi:PHD/YefM family antitoxin component YafN of YafNO toxin-antitoxin module